MEIGRKVPETVALVAMGMSRVTYISDAMKAGGPKGLADEIWVVNKLGSVYHHDIVFRMDDLRKPRKCNLRRGNNIDPSKTINDTQEEWMKNHDKPIITSTAYPEYPTSVSYPLEEVINTLGYSYFITTPAYAVAFAIHIGVKTLKMYGCDYIYPNNPAVAEAGKGNLEFILGLGMAMGMRVEVASTSTLLGTNLDIGEHLYGYEDIIEVVESKQEGKRYELRKRPDLTKKHNDILEERERKTLEILKQKYEPDAPEKACENTHQGDEK